MRPDAEKHYNPDPAYIGELIINTEMTRDELAAKLGVTDRSIRHWIAGTKKVAYTTQYALENLGST